MRYNKIIIAFLLLVATSIGQTILDTATVVYTNGGGVVIDPSGFLKIGTNIVNSTNVLNWNESYSLAKGIYTISSKNMDMTTKASTNDSLAISNNFVNVIRGKIYPTLTNTFSRTLIFTAYANSDYLCSNAYYKAQFSMVSVALTNAVPVGTNIIYVADSSGFTTNDLIYFTQSNGFQRVSAVGTGYLQLGCTTTSGHSTTSNVARAIEFGGFTTECLNGTSNFYYSLSSTTTNFFNQNIQLELEYKK